MHNGRVRVTQNTEGNILITIEELVIELTYEDAMAIRAFLGIFDREVFNGDTYNERQV